MKYSVTVGEWSGVKVTGKITDKERTHQAETAALGTLVHWAGIPTGKCTRKDNKVDVVVEQCESGATIVHTAEASFLGNISCLICRQAAWKAGLRSN